MTNHITPEQWNQLVHKKGVEKIKVGRDYTRLKLDNFHTIVVYAILDHSEFMRMEVSLESNDEEWDYDGEWHEPSYFDD